MKRATALIMSCLILLLCACGRDTSPVPETQAPTTAAPLLKDAEEFRGIWFSFYELNMESENGGSEQDFRQKIQEMLDNTLTIGVNNVFVHVRPFADALYESSLFPWSAILTGEQGRSPGYDPLLIMTQEAHARNIKIHAWLNPFRVSKSDDFSQLSDNNIAKVWHNDESLKSRVCVVDGKTYFNPTVPAVHELIYNGIREIIEKYDVDGIHIDDYFYPTTDEEIDAEQYDVYVSAGGELPLADWRRANISAFVSGMYSTVKASDSGVIVSISPSSNIEKAYNEMYADVVEWSTSVGYTDYIIPQIYFGFEHETMPFSKVAEEWSKTADGTKVRLLYGLASYKTGLEDEYARAGKLEWTENSDIIARQITEIRTKQNCNGFVLYSYNSFFSDGINKISSDELKNVKDCVIVK